ncbi:MAG TPA: glycosyltransferase family 2 protein [Patescibacteria group bacterium]|nr:glycosyltransferase family 2 protein [Patescibacteria group bacterium]
MAEKNITLSIAIATYNEEKNIARCLQSVASFTDEVMLVDGRSTDKTVSIAKTFGAHIIETNNPSIFHINKQKALVACKGEWILQLDADEVIPDNLREEILSITNKKENGGTNGYFIPRKNYFWGHVMKKGGQYPDYVMRLVRRGKASFPCKSVHEQIAVDGKVGYIIHPMLHYSYMTRADYWKKADTYIKLTAQELVKNHTYSHPMQVVTYFFIKPISTFFSIFLRHKGFIDGLTGFEFSLYSAFHFPLAYIKGLSLRNTT